MAYRNTVGISGMDIFASSACFLYCFHRQSQLEPRHFHDHVQFPICFNAKNQAVLSLSPRKREENRKEHKKEKLTFNPIHRIVPTSLLFSGESTLPITAFSPVGLPASNTDSPLNRLTSTSSPLRTTAPTSTLASTGSPMKILLSSPPLGTKRTIPVHKHIQFNNPVRPMEYG